MITTDQSNKVDLYKQQTLNIELVIITINEKDDKNIHHSYQWPITYYKQRYSFRYSTITVD